METKQTSLSGLDILLKQVAINQRKITGVDCRLGKASRAIEEIHANGRCERQREKRS